MNPEPEAALDPAAELLARPARSWVGRNPMEAGTMGADSLAVLVAPYRAWRSIGLAGNVFLFVRFLHLCHDRHQWFEAALELQPVPWHVVRGSQERRMQEVLHWTADLFKASTWKPNLETV